LNGKLKAHKHTHNLSEMTADLIAKGFDVNKESLRSRSKVRKTIGDIEKGQDKIAKHALADSDADDVVMDDKLAAKESKQRGRDKKRTKTVDSDIDMSEDDDTSAVKTVGRSLTPA